MLTFNFSVTLRDIQAFLNGAAAFALFAEGSLLFVLFKIEGFLDWSDLAFTIHLAGDETIVSALVTTPTRKVSLAAFMDTTTHLTQTRYEND